MQKKSVGFAVETNRELKAKKIEAVLKDYLNLGLLNKKKILDLGCGSGIIGEYFSLNNSVYQTDIVDQRKRKIVPFEKIKNSKLNYQNNFFDIVISNHVIEHVSDQKKHASEIIRVLKPGGVCYLATPNKYFPVEPHYKIPFIHYLPLKYFYKIITLIKGKKSEKILLLSLRDLEKIFNKFSLIDYTKKIFNNPRKFYQEIPIYFRKLSFLSPTIIILVKKR